MLLLVFGGASVGLTACLPHTRRLDFIFITIAGPPEHRQQRIENPQTLTVLSTGRGAGDFGLGREF